MDGVVGRPTIYNEELIRKLLSRIIEGRGLVSVCRDKDMPSKTTVYDWLADDDKKDFSDRYAKACEMRAELIFEEVMDIVDDVAPIKDEIAKARLQMDARKWFLSKLMPKKYGDRITDEIIGNDDNITINVVRVSKNKDE